MSVITAKVELGRFFQMFAEGVEKLTMPSKYIDRIWHELIAEKETINGFVKIMVVNI